MTTAAPDPAKADGRLSPLRTARLRNSSAAALLILVASAALGYLAQLGTVRLIGPSSFGVYVYALAWVTLLSQLVTLGSHVSLLRLVSEYRARQEWSLMAGVFHATIGGTVVAGLAVAAVGWVFLWTWRPVSTELSLTLLAGLATMPLLGLQLVLAAAVRSFGEVVAALVPERLVRDSVALAALSGLLSSGLAPANAMSAMLAMLVSAGTILLLSLYLTARHWPPQARHSARSYQLAAWFRPALPLTAIMVADVIMARFGLVVLGLSGNTHGAGIFAVCYGLSVLVAMPRMALATVFAPTVASLNAQGDTAGLQALIRRSALLSLAGTMAVAIPTAIATPTLLALFGPDFATGRNAALILILGQLVASAAGPQQHILTMTGRERAGASMHLAAAVAGTALCFMLVPVFGMTGAALSVTAAVIGWNIAMAMFVSAHFGLRPGFMRASQATT